ncbi:hypothetical protein BJ138DRAFT_984235, partial [Hygrophoropsis aurantiaca]
HSTGELEATMLHSFIKGAKLRAWLSRPECPPTIQECKVLLDQAYGKKGDDVQPLEDNIQSSHTAKAIVVPEDLRELI